VMTQPGETDGYSAWDHCNAIIGHANKNVINACIVNNALVPQEALNRYKAEDQFPVKPTAEKIKDNGYKILATDLLSVGDYVRHDSSKLTKALIKLIETHRVIRR